MSSVTPSDGGYSSNIRTLSELEDDLRAESKKNEERRRARADESQSRQLEAIRRAEKSMEKTVEDIRRNSMDSYDRSQENFHDEAERIKTQTYDRFGRYNTETLDLKTQIDELKRSAETQRANELQNSRAADKYHEQRISDAEARNLSKLEKAVGEARESALAAYNQNARGEKDSYAGARADAESRYRQLEHDKADEARAMKSHSEKALKEALEQSRYSTDRIQKHSEHQIQQNNRVMADRSVKDQERLRESHQGETNELRDQIKNLLESQKNAAHDQAEARAQVTREREGEFRTFNQLTTEKNDAESRFLKRQLADAEDRFGRRNNASLRDKDTFFTEVISRQNSESHATQKDLIETFQNDRAQLENQMRRDRDQTEVARDKEREIMVRQREEALANQAKNAGESRERQRQSDQVKVQHLERELQSKISATSASDISPAAEERSRQTFLRESGKLDAADKQRTENAISSIQREYSKRLEDTVQDTKASQAQQSQQHALERHLDRSAFMSTVADMVVEKDATVLSAAQRHERETEAVSRNHARAMEKQRRDYEEIINTLRNDAIAKQSAIRQEADFNFKMAQRAFSSKQNELIREYDKKLANQKLDFETQIDDLKSGSQHQMHEKERLHRQMLEEQARGFDQRVAQLEAQHKERERNITQNYADELEKVKRSNALLIQKKS